MTLREIASWFEPEGPMFYLILALGYLSALICACTAGRRR